MCPELRIKLYDQTPPHLMRKKLKIFSNCIGTLNLEKEHFLHFLYHICYLFQKQSKIS